MADDEERMSISNSSNPASDVSDHEETAESLVYDPSDPILGDRMVLKYFDSNKGDYNVSDINHYYLFSIW